MDQQRQACRRLHDFPIPRPDFEGSIEYQRLSSVPTLQVTAAFGSEKQAAAIQRRSTRISRDTAWWAGVVAAVSCRTWLGSPSSAPYGNWTACTTCMLCRTSLTCRRSMVRGGPRPSLAAAPGWFAPTAACVGQLLRTAMLSCSLAAIAPVSSGRCKRCGIR